MDWMTASSSRACKSVLKLISHLHSAYVESREDATPLFTQVIVDKVLIHQSLSMLNVLLLGMILLSVFQTVVSALRSYFMAFTGMKLDQSLFLQFYKHVLSLPLGLTLIDVVIAFANLLIIFFYNFSFGIFTLIYVAIFAVVAFAVAPTLRTIRRRCFHKDVAANSFLLESVRGIEKIKSAAAENRTRWAWEMRFVDALNATGFSAGGAVSINVSWKDASFDFGSSRSSAIFEYCPIKTVSGFSRLVKPYSRLNPPSLSQCPVSISKHCLARTSGIRPSKGEFPNLHGGY